MILSINLILGREDREKSKKSSLIKRAVSSIILAPVTLFLLFLGAPFVNLFALLCGTLLAWEWATMVPNTKNALYTAAYASSVAVVCFMPAEFIFLTLLVLFIATFVVFVKAKEEPHRALLVLGVPYISLGIGSLVWFYALTNSLLLIWFFLVIWGVDVGAFIVGTTVKGPKLAPSISPNKTWSGLLGGMLFACIVSYFFVLAMNQHFEGHLSMPFFVISSAVLAVISQMGDLFESRIKRYLNIKDSSNLIPGHGGIFDRVDGLLFAAPVVALFLLFSN